MKLLKCLQIICNRLLENSPQISRLSLVLTPQMKKFRLEEAELNSSQSEPVSDRGSMKI
jgi:hypothetical protein